MQMARTLLLRKDLKKLLKMKLHKKPTVIVTIKSKVTTKAILTLPHRVSALSLKFSHRDIEGASRFGCHGMASEWDN